MFCAGPAIELMEGARRASGSEIINNPRGGIEGKIGERGVWGGQIQSHKKKVILDEFFSF